MRAVCAAVAAAIALAACGGSSSSSATASRRHPATPVIGKLVATNHAPKVGVNWPYTVTVTDAAGHPLTGTVTIEFTFGGQVVGHDTPPTHSLSQGRWHDNLRFPPQAVGEPIDLQAVVHTPKGSITLTWPVTATK